MNSFSRLLAVTGVLLAPSCSGGSATSPDPGSGGGAAAPDPALRHQGEVHFADVIQLTRGAGENAEAYWSFDGSQLIFQSKRAPYQCDQIYRVPSDGSAAPELVSTGKGRTTCAYFLPGDDRVVWSSTHHLDAACPPPPDMSQGYVWPLHDFDIFASDPDGSNLVQLTDTPAYEAEATVCPEDGSILFTSTRDGDLEIYRMDKDGGNVVRLTHAPGYDGGAFFSPDCEKIVWRASRPTGEALADYKRLLSQKLVRPTHLEIWVADADGQNARQVTYLGAASFAPFFHPSGERILFSTNHPNPRGREFDIWAVDVDGTDLERITYAPGFDGFPMFSPDGTRLAFGSNRNQAEEGETDVYVARWIDGAGERADSSAADRFYADVRWLADDAREGRGIGTDGLDQAADWLVEQMREIGAEGALEGGSFEQELNVPVEVEVGEKTALALGRREVRAEQFVPASFSARAQARGKTVYVGYGIVADDLDIDDYAGKRVKGKIAVVRRFTPEHEAFEDADVKRRYSDLHYKAFTARERGARGVIFVDLAGGGEKAPEEAPLPEVKVARLKDVGIPVVIVKREVGAKLAKGSHFASIAVELDVVEKPARNIVAVIRAGAKDKLEGAVVLGAHYDHLGLGGESSLEPGLREVHNGADDNASGTAGLLEAARELVARRDELRRDVYLVAFTAEESGLLGSSHFVKNPPAGLKMDDVVAMLNMDMIGRLRNNTVNVVGGGTAKEWDLLVSRACQGREVRCSIGGSGYGPSDQTPFYAAGVPVLQFFTGAHGDYHKSTDDTGRVNAAGGVRIAGVVADVAADVAGREDRLTYKKVAAPPPRGDARSFGASMGTIPDYADKGDRPGMLISGVRPDGPADRAGIEGGDRILKVGDTEVRTVHDLVHVLRSAKPGQRVRVVIERAGKKKTVKLTFGKSRRRGR